MIIDVLQNPTAIVSLGNVRLLGAVLAIPPLGGSMSLTIQPMIDQVMTQRYRAEKMFAIRTFHIASFIFEFNTHFGRPINSAHASYDMITRFSVIDPYTQWQLHKAEECTDRL